MSLAVREPIIAGDIALIPLTGGLFAKVDLSDLHLVAGVNWQAKRATYRTYATRSDYRQSGRQSFIQMHRVIMSAPEGVFVDHINLDGLDCRRSNLRLCNRFENARNRPMQKNNSVGYKGVSRLNGKFGAHIRVDGVKRHLGCFETAEEAHSAYAEAARQFHGEFARAS